MTKVKESPGNKAHRLLAESDYAEKLRKGVEKLWRNSIFQKELRSAIKKRLLPRKKGYPAHYSKEWIDFCNRWDIECASFRTGKCVKKELILKGSIRVGQRWSRDKETIFMEPVPGKISTQRDMIDHIPLYHHLTSELCGAPRRGRPSTRERDQEIRATIKRRRQKEDRQIDIISDLAIQYDLSHDRIRKIAYSRKNDI